MKKFYLLLALTAFMTIDASAQDDQQAIHQWQSLHPSTLLISAERYNKLSSEEQQLLGKDVIVFQDHITLAQLNAYTAEKNGESATDMPAKTEDLEAIKIWIGQHPDVRIIPQSKYTTLSEPRLLEAHTASCIILAGEVLTLKDIQHYTELYGQ